MANEKLSQDQRMFALRMHAEGYTPTQIVPKYIEIIILSADVNTTADILYIDNALTSSMIFFFSTGLSFTSLFRLR